MIAQTKALIVTLAVGLAAFLAAAPASAQSSAPLTVCNKTSLALGTAIGYHTPGVSDPADHSLLTGPFVTRGWASIAPGTCHSFDNPFNARYMFWFGYSTQYHNDVFGTGWTPASTVAATQNPVAWCVPNFFKNAPGFTYERENTKVDDPTGATDYCVGADTPNMWVYFNMVDTWIDPTVNFTGQ